VAPPACRKNHTVTLSLHYKQLNLAHVTERAEGHLHTYLYHFWRQFLRMLRRHASMIGKIE
jgi:hypothetical protein